MSLFAIFVCVLFHSTFGYRKLQEISPQFQFLADLQSEISPKEYTMPEVGLPLEQLISYYNYPSEIHEVVTEDGYILTLYRIPHGSTKTNLDQRPVVLLMPGLLCDAGWFVINGKNSSLGFWLADRGYDVWMANYRGTTHSRRHVTLDPDVDKAQFWDFSFNEMGYYDNPTFIDYVLNVTGQEDLYYIGHSQGTTAFFVTASELPQYNSKIRLMASLAPVAFMSHTTHPIIRFLADNKDIIYFLATTFGFYEILPHSELVTLLGAELCNDEAFTQPLCVAILGVSGGFNNKELNKTTIPVLTSHIPSGASIKQLTHYSQEVISGHFRKFDYGIAGNLITYGNLSPPDYDISNITAPVAFFCGKNDLFSNPADVDLLAERLPNLVLKYFIEDEEFTHLDFGWAIHSEDLYFRQLLQLLEQY